MGEERRALRVHSRASYCNRAPEISRDAEWDKGLSQLQLHGGAEAERDKGFAAQDKVAPGPRAADKDTAGTEPPSESLAFAGRHVLELSNLPAGSSDVRIESLFRSFEQDCSVYVR